MKKKKSDFKIVIKQCRQNGNCGNFLQRTNTKQFLVKTKNPL